LNFNEIGQVLSFALAIFGATIGCYITGTTAYKLWNKTGVDKMRLTFAAAQPLFVTVYGFTLMLLLNQSVLAGGVSAELAMTIGSTTGVVFMIVGILQGKVSEPALKAAVIGPSAFARAIIPIAFINMIPLFTFCGALLFI
jgi:V/A-type H+-transporting ATPase subunit K